MPKVDPSYLDARRREILEAAIRCFSRQGFHRTTMRDIVRESKRSPGAIYNYFKSKEDIIEAVASERHLRERAAIAVARDEPHGVEAFRRIREAFFGPLRDPKDRRRRRVSIQMWAEAQRNPRVLGLVRRGIDQPRRLLATMIGDAQRRREVSRDLDPDAVARFMVAVFHGFVLQLEWDEHVAVEPFVEVLDLCLKQLFGAEAQGPKRRRSRKLAK
jgi:AcrR family transcriptional regulator